MFLDDNTFEGNRLAVAVKGGSRAFIESGHHRENETDIFAYKKQKSFGGGDVLFLNPTSRNGLSLFADAQSDFWVTTADRRRNAFDRDDARSLLERSKERGRPLMVGRREFDRVEAARREAAAVRNSGTQPDAVGSAL